MRSLQIGMKVGWLFIIQFGLGTDTESMPKSITTIQQDTITKEPDLVHDTALMHSDEFADEDDTSPETNDSGDEIEKHPTNMAPIECSKKNKGIPKWCIMAAATAIAIAPVTIFGAHKSVQIYKRRKLEKRLRNLNKELDEIQETVENLDMERLVLFKKSIIFSGSVSKGQLCSAYAKLRAFPRMMESLAPTKMRSGFTEQKIQSLWNEIKTGIIHENFYLDFTSAMKKEEREALIKRLTTDHETALKMAMSRDMKAYLTELPIIFKKNYENKYTSVSQAWKEDMEQAQLLTAMDADKYDSDAGRNFKELQKTFKELREQYIKVAKISKTTNWFDPMERLRGGIEKTIKKLDAAPQVPVSTKHIEYLIKSTETLVNEVKLAQKLKLAQNELEDAFKKMDPEGFERWKKSQKTLFERCLDEIDEIEKELRYEAKIAKRLNMQEGLNLIELFWTIPNSLHFDYDFQKLQVIKLLKRIFPELMQEASPAIQDYSTRSLWN